jgi:RNA-splicing ligase RtcB
VLTERAAAALAALGGQLADESGVVEGDGSLAVHGFNFTTLSDHRAATEGGECRKDKDVIDETPAAYKAIDAVM